MGDEEVRLVREAILKARRDLLIFKANELDFDKLTANSKEIERIQSDLAKAEKAVSDARHFGWLKNIKVAWLTSKIERVKRRKLLMTQQAAASKDIADSLLDEARQAWEDASASQIRRVAYVTSLCDTKVSERKESLRDDLIRCSSFGDLTVLEAAKMEMRALEDLVACQAENLIFLDAARVDTDIRKAIQNEKEKDDYAWFSRVTGFGRELYNKSQASFCEQLRGRNFDYRDLVAPVARLRCAFASSKSLEATVRQSLRPLVVSYAEQRDDSENPDLAIAGADSNVEPESRWTAA
jgi:hypothetical protein